MKRKLVLELLEHLLLCGTSIMIGALFAPRGQGLGRSLRDLDQKIGACPHDFSLHSKSTISTTLSKLKQSGLVVRRGPKKKTIWFITSKGKLHFRKRGSANAIPPEDGKVRLVIYDIPEEMRTNRVWIRNKLLACDYAYLQRSVWVGTRPLPEKLLREFKERKLLHFVHVVGLDGLLSDTKNRL